ncbi:MAG: class I SAM-dependent methyltransferase [Betaproteobacteria bacterium]
MTRWPLPAVLVWFGCWAILLGLRAMGWAPWLSLALACMVGLASAPLASTRWRRAFIALGFPLSVALSAIAGSGAMAWIWLLPLLVLLLLYPVNAWRDAPLFPTPPHALRELARHAPLAQGARVLDAGCGLGDGLKALREAYPHAQLDGVEWSWPLRAACALRCPWARVRQADIWDIDWGPYAMVYLFQRPESMARAAAKARSQMLPGAWLVSLEFAVQDWAPGVSLRAPDGRPIWVYPL